MKDSRPDSVLRTPASKRISSPASARLNTITENGKKAPPPIPPKSILRNSTSNLSLPRSIIVTPPAPGSDKFDSSIDTSRTAPPAYEWVPEPILVDDESVVSGPVEGEKLAELRRNGGHKRREKKGGWWRMLLIIVVVSLVVIGLAVGLGVGLTVGRQRKGDSTASTLPANDTGGPESQPFPLGEFTILTSLKDVSTNCTSNPDTWTCYPRTTYDAANPSLSLATFNWVLKNTSSSYATIGSGNTPDQGVPANISISSTDNPLSITFNDRALTYISLASNTSSARYTFSFTMEKSVFPSTSLTNDGVASECFFNQTLFTGTLYLSEPKNYPPANDTNGFEATGMQWPYAIEVVQSSGGGDDSPACYQYANGDPGQRITSGLTAQPVDSQCECGYKNF